MKNRPTKGFPWRLLLLILTMIDQAMLAPHLSDEQHLVEKRTHLKFVIQENRNFTCKKAQQRAYNVRDYLPSESARQYLPTIPKYIVLNRCDSHSGCCSSHDLSCAPVASTIYYEEMEIEMLSLLNNSKSKMWIRVVQHRNCSCESVSASERDVEPSIEIL